MAQSFVNNSTGNNKESYPPSSQISNQLNAKMQEIDNQLKAILALPQYPTNIPTYAQRLSRQYSQTEQFRYMSLSEHLRKAYEVNPYLFGEREVTYYKAYSPAPVFLSPYEPFRYDPPLFSLHFNHLRNKRWVEFIPFNDLNVIRQEIEEAYDIASRTYIPRVISQVIMPIEEARRLMFIMQQPNFTNEDYALLFSTSRDIYNLQKQEGEMQKKLFENLGEVKSILNQQELRQKELQNEVEGLRNTINKNQIKPEIKVVQVSLPQPVKPQNKKNYGDDDDLNYYKKRSFKPETIKGQGVSSLEYIPDETDGNLEKTTKKSNQQQSKLTQPELKQTKSSNQQNQQRSEYLEIQKKQQTSITSISQIGGIQRKFKPSSTIKLTMRAFLPNENDEYYDHQISLTDIEKQQISNTNNNLDQPPGRNQVVTALLETGTFTGSRQNILLKHNQLVASQTNLDNDLSTSFSKIPAETNKNKQVLESYYEEGNKNNNPSKQFSQQDQYQSAFSLGQANTTIGNTDSFK